MAPLRRIAVGDVLDGKYEIIGILGEGAMGVVYEARHKRLQRTVALKTLLDDIAGSAELVSRFEREARAASAIGHPNIVQVFDAGDEPIPYLVMERLEGQSLEERLAQAGPIPAPAAIALVRECLAGLAAAHRGGIVHRDLKPGNLFITDADESGHETMKILDFGISKILDATDGGDGRATQAGMVMGTPLYMSPEQTRGQIDIDHRADLWSMACVLYECLAGQPPFDGDNHNQVMAAVLDGSFVSLKERCPALPESLSSLIDRALSPDIDTRFSDAEALAAALENILEPELSSVPGDAAAFENLADRFLAQEAEEEARLDVPASGPVPKRPAPAGSQFAPPDSSSPIGLALDIDNSTHSRRERTSSRENVVPEARTGSRRRANSQWVTRDEPSRIGATLLKLFLVIALVAGAGAGYRYYTLGHVLPKEAPAMASLSVAVVPAHATVLLDNVAQDTGPVELEGDRQYRITLRADGYLAMRAHMKPATGQVLSVKTQLSHQMRSLQVILPGEPASEPTAIPDLSAEEIATGYAKLDALVQCGARLAESLQAALAANEREAEAVAYNLVDECRLVVEVNAPKEPSLAPLDGASIELVEDISALNQAIRDHQSSAGASSKVRRKLRGAVQGASARARKSRLRWLAAMNTAESRWQQEESARIAAREGDSLHARLRALVVASDTWNRARIAESKEEPALREIFSELHAAETKRAETEVDAYKESGAALLLRALAPLASEMVLDDPLAHHNQAVVLFNQLKLPLGLN